jgi:hypothetical protein
LTKTQNTKKALKKIENLKAQEGGGTLGRLRVFAALFGIERYTLDTVAGSQLSFFTSSSMDFGFGTYRSDRLLDLV